MGMGQGAEFARTPLIDWWFVIDRMPDGFAPEVIREDWVGVALPVRGDLLSAQVEDLTDQDNSASTLADIERVDIKLDDAIQALTLFGRDPSAKFWDMWGFSQTGRVSFYPITLSFSPQDGRIVADHEVRQSLPVVADFRI